jgi:large subunit ribosomal protein L10
MARPDKAAAVAELTEAFRGSSAAMLTEYRGLTVAQLKELRTSLAGNATYAVVKNTLTKIAARDAGVDGLDALLEGPSAIAFVTGDPVEVAKGLRDFARNNPPLIVKGGVLDGKSLSADEIRRLADLESREVLLGRLAGGMKASLQQAVSLFAAPLSQMARLAGALQAKATEDPSVIGGPGEAVSEPTAEAVDEPTPDTVSEPTAEAADEPTPDTVSEPTAEAADEPTAAAGEEPDDSTPAANPPITDAPTPDVGPAADTGTEAADTAPADLPAAAETEPVASPETPSDPPSGTEESAPADTDQ